MKKNIALALTAVLLTLLALEFAWRFYVHHFGSLRQKVLYLYSQEEIQELQSLFRGLPYVNFGLSPARDDINSRGYRGPEIEVPKPPETYRIVALGGSTTYGGYLDSYELAYPHQLQQILKTEYNLSDVEVINAGVPAYASWESAVNFMFRVQDLEPNLIILYHGINDLNARLTDPAHYSGGFEGRGIWSGAEEPAPASALYRLALHKLGRSVNVAWSLEEQLDSPVDIRGCVLKVSGDEAICANLGMTVEAVLRANPPIYFERNLNNIISMAQFMGVDALLLSWAYSPYAYDAAHGDIMIHEFRQREIARQNEIIRRLAAERGVLFYDLAESMPIDRQYWHNGVHMSASGTAEMAGQLAQFLAPRIDLN